MKLTQQAEAELLKDYYQLWTANLSADVETFASYMVDDFSIFGSANGEIFFTKDEAIEFYAATAHELKDKAQLRDRNISIQALDENNVVIRETSNLYVLIGDVWTFYGFARISCVLKQIDKRWKVVHQHASFPDHRTEEGQQLAAEAIEKENLQLREAVKRRTIELEQKNRELQIESSLERIRAVAMSMNKTDDVLSICKVMFKEMGVLGFKDVRNALINFWDDDHQEMLDYDYADFSGGNTSRIPYNSHPAFEKFQEHIRSATDSFVELAISGDELKTWKERRKRIGEYEDPRLESIPALYYYFYSFGAGAIGLSTFSPVVEESLHVLKRFRHVFDLAYRRYIDIQKAEEQAREAMIESGLERVRSRGLAMHNTSELQEVIHTVHKELLNLNIAIHGGSFIAINSDIDTTIRCWGSGGTADTSDEVHLPLYEKPFCTNLISGIKKGPGFFTEQFTRLEKKEFFTFLFRHEPWSNLEATQKEEIISAPGGYTRSCCVSQHTSIFIINQLGEKFSEVDNDILKRFGKVFEQTYTRFLDLQKAEVQSREAQIELALERVRARTMAMQHSDELADVSFLLDSQVRALSIETWGCAFNIYGNGESTEWFSSEAGTLPAYKTPREKIFLRYYEAGQRGESLHIEEFDGEDCAAHYEYLCTVPIMGDALKQIRAAGGSFPTRQIDHVSYFKYGYLLFITLYPVLEAHDIFKRFAKVFEQTYTRFLDLQIAEAQAREAQIELSMERIRAQVTSMQSSPELLDIVVMMRKEFVTLGYEAHYFWYMRWLPDIYEKAMTSGDGTRIGMVMTLPRSIHGDIKLLADWEKSNDPFVVYAMDVDAAVSYVDKMVSLGHFEIVDPNAPTLDDIRHIGGLTFVMARTSHGEIGFSLTGPVPNPSPEAINTLLRFAGVFDLAYKRFLDLQLKENQSVKLKQEKERLEFTLAELKATQSQLIQSEKMASLGELTAGIAHEIQNPLNFVNNFSEVSKELLDEMKEALESGDTHEAKEIAADIIQNLEKIAHHGKRADAIVKGMLQHSRASSNQKELTDINALADEYLRLAYHGLRAKDKSFNATLKTDFDEGLRKVSIVPQDIGRAILNLITNAFYAVSEMKKSAVGDFEPTVSLTTKKFVDRVELRVADNGNGIPQEIIDKIFQPFFTTKPTGQGTGLGLSMSYDIITKGHNGVLEVESTAGQGSQFIIQLPITNTHENISGR
ncbi:MAG: hypothetical protein EOO53_20340 [Gammaproteobacteria bacterium]|nr:MAG: hypothetical protein EOO53_20340 [Gammaproteobacteria bacterium]